MSCQSAIVRIDAGRAHEFDLRSPQRQARFFDLDRSALVLGSSQSDASVDYAECTRLGIDVVRRRSGGGAVLLEPGGGVWLDVWLPRHDELWVDDVGRAMWWIGELWCSALIALGLTGEVHRSPAVRPSVAALCFTGVGPGEVKAHGKKAVGISARRTRDGARFQTYAYCGDLPAGHARLLGLDPSADGVLRRLADPVAADPGVLTAALIAALDGEIPQSGGIA